METKREYLVYKQSINQGKSHATPEEKLIFNCSLIFWNKMWWQTGTAMAVKDSNYKTAYVPAYTVPWTYSDEIQKMQQEQLEEMYNVHLEVCGSPLYTQAKLVFGFSLILNKCNFVPIKESNSSSKS